MIINYSKANRFHEPMLYVQQLLPLYEDDLAFQLPEDDISFTIYQAVLESGILELFDTSARVYKGYDPATLLTAILLGFCEEGYVSTRKLAKKCRFDLRYRYLFGQNLPSHMVFQRFISKNLDEGDLEEMLVIINTYIQNKIPLDLETMYIDGTKLEANANKFTFVWRKTAERNLGSNYAKFWGELDKINQFFLKQGQNPAFSVLLQPNLKNAYSALEKAGKLCEEYCTLFKYGKGTRKHPLQRSYDILNECMLNIYKYSYYLEEMGSKNSLSKTDHDAAFLHIKYDYYCNTGVFKPGSNIQVGVCDGFIWDVHIDTHANDIRSYIPFMDNFHRHYGYYPKNVCADAGYGSYDNYLYNLSHGIESYIKYPHWEKEQHKYSKDEYKPFRFTFDDNLILRCPEGNAMEPVSSRRDYRNEGVYSRFITTYATPSCQGCPNRSRCTKAAEGRKVTKTVGLDELQDHVRENLHSDAGKELRKQRDIQSEGTFGQIKEDYKYNRCRRRGLNNVKKEFLLVSIGFNLRKFHNRLHNREEEPELAA